MSLVEEILYTLLNYRSRGFRVLYEDVYALKRAEQKDRSFERTLRSTLSRMKRNGLLKKNARCEWTITPEGDELLKGRNSDIKRFFPASRPQIRASKNLIVIFDIPEKIRRYRDWLRVELVGFGFEQIQKSVWFGPPLPKEFVEYLEEARILKYLRFFKASEKDLI
jgi:DNA-binding transcriptional regulator PaaX